MLQRFRLGSAFPDMLQRFRLGKRFRRRVVVTGPESMKNYGVELRRKRASIFARPRLAYILIAASSRPG